ncbi:2'-deoxycytidine 5'-triphosphate deaminase [Rhodobiaceae bacterium]|nr:2'-deoxycytidine 5'-triphosphate deaminase [Rhodobiaceae bacterium]|tara:strand:+ start:744 stop:1913 length:1170 start_codon:yes stop_codon:yes gene_type:complete
MTEKKSPDLFPDSETISEDFDGAPGQKISLSGILPGQIIRSMIESGEVWSQGNIEEEQIQPASLDLRLSDIAYRIRASFLPSEGSVKEKLSELALHKIDISDGAVLETGCVYLVPLMEALSLPERITAISNPKSSTGRVDVFTRLICDGSHEFDKVPGGYKGHLWLEISPRTFPVIVRQGTRLNQMRFRRGRTTSSDTELKRLHSEEGIVYNGKADISEGLAISVNLNGNSENEIVGYKAKRHAGLIDLDKPNKYSVSKFWDPVFINDENRIILDPGEFYILASYESIAVPPSHAAEMVPFNPSIGEFRVHYAGFFDPGFGHGSSDGQGSKAVLEVRGYDVPFILEHNQIVGRLMYEKLTEFPEKFYGSSIGSNYQKQNLKLSKHFIQD